MSDGAATKTSAVAVQGTDEHQAVCHRVLLLYKLMKILSEKSLGTSQELCL